MIPRAIQAQVVRSLAHFPAVGLVGPRQVGKTTLAQAIQAEWAAGEVLYLDLERPADLARLGQAELFLARYADHLVVIDEAQRRPDLFPILRVLIDGQRRAGRFLILGSAAPDLKHQASESLAGRIAYHELAPFTLPEVGANGPAMNAMHRLWLRGGYPGSFLAESDALSGQWRENFIQTHLERDIPVLGLRVPATALRRFWTMAAHGHGQTWNASRIGESMGINHKTARHYLDILTDTFMLRQLPPCLPNVGKQLVKSPKLYVRCPGLLHSLLNVGDWSGLQGHPIRGTSWEGFCIEQVLAVVPKHWQASFYRTRSGAELDLVLHPVAMQPSITVEVKASAAPALTRGNRSAIADLAPRMSYVLYPGTERYPMAERVEALPLTQLSAITESAAS